MLSLLATSHTKNDKNGNGKYKGLRRRKVKKTASAANGFRYLTNNDLTMQFNDSKDPIYFAFEYLEQRTLPQLMDDFVKDSFFSISTFVYKVINK